jgi:DNA-binding GntR family transcriptional regulator
MLEVEGISLAHTTIGATVYESIRQAIIDHRLAPGSQLRTDPLAGRLGVSRTPVIETLNRLRQEGLVTYSGYHGFVVEQAKTVDLAHLFDGRAICETYGVSYWVRVQPRIEDLSKLRDAVGQLETLAGTPGTIQQWYAAEFAIHSQLVGLAHNPLVSDWHQRAMVIINSHWPPVPTSDEPYVNAPSIAEHRGIMQAIQKQDVAAAAEAVRQHASAEMGRMASFINSAA